MLTFQALCEENSSELREGYRNSPYRISDYSYGIKKMWSDLLHPEFTFDSGCLLVLCTLSGRPVFDYPLPVAEEYDLSSALLHMAEYCRENFLPFQIDNIPEEERGTLLSLFPSCELSYRRIWSDYLYRTADLAAMEGKAYAGQRNHIRKFQKSYPGAVFRRFDGEDEEKIRFFFRRFSSEFLKGVRGAKSELSRAENMISQVGSPNFFCGGYVLDGEILSFCLSERCGDMLIDHIEKALPEFEGIYPATVQAFLKEFGEGIPFFNREDDSADRGLRMSKLQYHPLSVVHKYTAHIRNELWHIERLPELSSERLTYDALRPEDIPAYNRLCLDDERNRYWGYDYRIDCENPGEEYFYNDQRHDFSTRSSLTLAIRLEGVFIGEVLLYNFDFRGGAEIGIRLLREYGGFGYAREALRTVISYGLYTVGLDEIRAKCYKENTASYNLLSAVMRRRGEDGDYEYFFSTF